MKNYTQFLLEKIKLGTLKYYMFDWDDNILVMPTIIHLEEFIDDEWVDRDVSTAEFAELRQDIYSEDKTDIRLKGNDPDQAYCEFRDFGPRGGDAFYLDALKAIKTNSFGPVWDDFIECLVSGSIFMIITARGHEPMSIRKIVEWVIFNYLTKEQKETMERNLIEFSNEFGWDEKHWNFNDIVKSYLDMCDFLGVSSKFFVEKFGIGGSSGKPEEFKAMAIKYFSNKINEFGKIALKNVKVGFSDDDLKTATKVNNYIKNELSLNFPIDYSVYYTKDTKKEL
jgi:hypothetical protein